MTTPIETPPTDPIRDAFEAILWFLACVIGRLRPRKITPAEEIGALAACEVETDHEPDEPPPALIRLRDLIQRAAEEHARGPVPPGLAEQLEKAQHDLRVKASLYEMALKDIDRLENTIAARDTSPARTEPLARGTRVRTVAHLTALFSPSLHPHRRPNALGKIVRRMTSGDIYYDVRHDDGTVAGYERGELIDLTAEAPAPVTDADLAEIEARTSGPGPLAEDGALLRRCAAEIRRMKAIAARSSMQFNMAATAVERLTAELARWTAPIDVDTEVEQRADEIRLLWLGPGTWASWEDVDNKDEWMRTARPHVEREARLRREIERLTRELAAVRAPTPCLDSHCEHPAHVSPGQTLTRGEAHRKLLGLGMSGEVAADYLDHEPPFTARSSLSLAYPGSWPILAAYQRHAGPTHPLTELPAEERERIFVAPGCGDAEQGLYRKFDVRRTDGSSGPGGKHEHCDYFVLDWHHDPFTVPAARTYADACEAKYPALASDLRAKASMHGPALTPAEEAEIIASAPGQIGPGQTPIGRPLPADASLEARRVHYKALPPNDDPSGIDGRAEAACHAFEKAYEPDEVPPHMMLRAAWQAVVRAVDASCPPTIFVPTQEQAQRSPLLCALHARGETERTVIDHLFAEVERLRLRLIKLSEHSANPLKILRDDFSAPETLASRPGLTEEQAEAMACSAWPDAWRSAGLAFKQCLVSVILRASRGETPPVASPDPDPAVLAAQTLADLRHAEEPAPDSISRRGPSFDDAAFGAPASKRGPR